MNHAPLRVTVVAKAASLMTSAYQAQTCEQYGYTAEL